MRAASPLERCEPIYFAIEERVITDFANASRGKWAAPGGDLSQEDDFFLAAETAAWQHIPNFEERSAGRNGPLSLARRAHSEFRREERKMDKGEFPLAYFITWTTYGTWLPGDERGWCKRGSRVIEPPDPALSDAARGAMTEEPVVLNQAQRELLDAVIVKHCAIRRWILHARNVRSNHVHIVVSAALAGAEVRAQLKAWCSRRLSEQAGLEGRSKNGLCRWFSERGDVEWIDDEEQLGSASLYVNEMQ
jgi:REP element-mobilizing transposase RayT